MPRMPPSAFGHLSVPGRQPNICILWHGRFVSIVVRSYSGIIVYLSRFPFFPSTSPGKKTPWTHEPCPGSPQISRPPIPSCLQESKFLESLLFSLELDIFGHSPSPLQMKQPPSCRNVVGLSPSLLSKSKSRPLTSEKKQRGPRRTPGEFIEPAIHVGLQRIHFDSHNRVSSLTQEQYKRFQCAAGFQDQKYSRLWPADQLHHLVAHGTVCCVPCPEDLLQVSEAQRIMVG